MPFFFINIVIYNQYSLTRSLYYTFRIIRTSVRDSNRRKAGGKTRNAARCLVLFKRFADFIRHLPLGRVIAQEFSGGTEIEEGTRVSLTVSGGRGFG